jgi:cytochrome P450
MPDDLDLLDPTHRQDPFPLYRRLRAEDPVHWSQRLGMWVVTRYDDVVHMLLRPLQYSVDRFRRIEKGFLERRPDMADVAAIMRDWAVYQDPPRHTRLRGLLNHTFTPRHLEAMRPRIQAVVDDLLDRCDGQAAIDFVSSFAFPLPATVIAALLGVPARDIAQIKTWSDQIAAYIGGTQAGKDNIDEAKRGLLRTRDYFRDLVRSRRRAPGDDVLGMLLAAEESGDVLSEDEVVANCILLLFAGHETTTNLLANGLFHLLRNPVQHALLQEHPALVPCAVEELLRYDPPVAGTIRVVTEDVELRGRRIPAGASVAAMLASANRDPDHFDEPERLDVRRSPNRHLAFGHGIHFCLGAGLARMEAQIAFATLLRRGRLRLLDEAPAWKPQIFFRGLRRLHVAPARDAEGGARAVELG